MASGPQLRLLVATEFAPDASGGGPAVVRQMLREWAKEGLFWWSCAPGRGPFHQECQATNSAQIPKKLMPLRRFTRFKSLVLDEVWRRWATSQFLHTVSDCAPDVVWAIPHNWAILPMSAVLPKSRIGFHTTIQDYVQVHGQESKFGHRLCRRMAQAADLLYISATTRDATSHPMLNDLKDRTQAEGVQMLHAGVEENELRQLKENRGKSSDRIRIAFAGTILVPEEFSLFVKALRELRLDLSMPLSIELFGSHSYRSLPWFDASWMQEHGDLAESELLNALKKCTWGFVPMARTDADARYNRFSFPTKFISYLAAGLPIISLGHPESALMNMASRYNVGVKTNAASLQIIVNDLRRPLADSEPWITYGSAIIRCAEEQFRASTMRSTLWRCFERCAETTRTQRAAMTSR
jgi:hypothetical protein